MTASAKDIQLRPISRDSGNRIIRALHYSGKVTVGSQIHLGVFLGGRCGGALQFGPSFHKPAMMRLVAGTENDQFIELNRMALADWLPRNGESRALAVSMRLLRKRYPRLKWVVTFADATQCGDGTIYRAAGFLLTGIARNGTMWRLPDGEVVAKQVMHVGSLGDAQRRMVRRYGRPAGEAEVSFLRRIGAEPLPGFQLRYVYFLDPSWRSRLTVPVLPYSELDRVGARMFRGQRVKPSGEASGDQPGQGGSIPTHALQPAPSPARRRARKPVGT